MSERLKDLFGNVGSADLAWNMLCLNPYLHRLFDRGYFGLKPVGVTAGPKQGTWEVQFQIFWFDPTYSTPSAEVEPSEENIHKMFIPSTQRKPENVVEHHALTHRVVQSGETFTVVFADKDEAEKMRDALALRWAVGEICAMAGGAGRPYDDPEYEDDEGQTGEHAS